MRIPEGSPPHTRGKAALASVAALASGITPAYAGKSHPPIAPVCRNGDHPRIRGEKGYTIRMICCILGSPPHTRGKAITGAGLTIPTGITPAYAGKSCPSGDYTRIKRDHPRIRGEKLQPKPRHLRNKGSPPHTRGKAMILHTVTGLPGITPASAGKRTDEEVWEFLHQDHPRIRGEKRRRLSTCWGRPGSPPHTRGKGNGKNLCLDKIGITPAYAGKRPSPYRFLWPNRDHPRIRGEKRAMSISRMCRLGSPPHTRGKDKCSINSKFTCGITPAYAGKRSALENWVTANGDHPRIRGEKFIILCRSSAGKGSPPHTRGKATHGVWGKLDNGITPAYAGKRRNRCS